MRRLAAMPMLGGECESDAPWALGLRIWPIHGFPNHLILYRIIEDGIRVLRVVHGAQDWQGLFGAPSAGE
jgi:plasmid stabilization system protein ParE